jgi:hypothetical protein
LRSQAVDLVEIQGTIEEISRDKAIRAAEAVCLFSFSFSFTFFYSVVFTFLLVQSLVCFISRSFFPMSTVISLLTTTNGNYRRGMGIMLTDWK